MAAAVTDQRAIEHLRASDPVLRRIIDAHPDFDPRAWLSELPSIDVFGAIVFQVVGQQLSVVATRRILDRLAERFGGRYPTAGQLLALEADQLAVVGMSRRKAATLRAVAEEFASGRLCDEELRALSDEEIEIRLTAINGIGPWTVHGVLIIALDRPDVVLPGDLALRNVVQRAYGLDHRPSQSEVLAIAEPWRPYRTLATSYLFQQAFTAEAPAPG